ncbi:MAG: Mth938-like domain-containing protein [Lautropia sp.]
MKLHADRTDALNTVTGYGEGWFEINRVRHAGAIVLRPEGDVAAWPVAGFDALTEADFAALLAPRPEVVLFGSGPTHRFPPPRLTAALMRAGVGVEVMASPAACRTYNILIGEGRQVVAALLPG